MNERIAALARQSTKTGPIGRDGWPTHTTFDEEKFAKLIVDEMCRLLEQAEDDAYHSFEPSERPTEYIRWLGDWRERFTEHFGVSIKQPGEQ